jgi:peptidyl-prolyl cis-trans isomerase A (cyclophilin A)
MRPEYKLVVPQFFRSSKPSIGRMDHAIDRRPLNDAAGPQRIAASGRKMKVLIAVCAMLAAGCGIATPNAGVKETTDVDVVLETSVGNIEIAVYTDKAPASAHAFLALVDNGALTEHGTFYRTVRKNENDHGKPTIDVVQGGLQDPPKSLPGIKHETTRETGLRHLDGTISLGRDAVGSATGAEFFICIGDQPALDLGGGRDPSGDGQGFAAFGRVTKGMETVRKIHQLKTGGSTSDPYLSGQMLDPPVRIMKAFRKGTPIFVRGPI